MNILLQYKLCSIQSLFACLLLQWRRQNSCIIKSLLYWCNLHVFFIVSEPSQIIMKHLFSCWMDDWNCWVNSALFWGLCDKEISKDTLVCLLYSEVYLNYAFLTFSICSLILFYWGDFVPQKLSIALYPEHLPSYNIICTKNCTCMNRAIVFNWTTFTGICSL